MAGTAASAELWSTSIGKSGWRALAASWLGWMFDGYKTYSIVLVMGQAVGELLPPEGEAVAGVILLAKHAQHVVLIHFPIALF